MGEAFGGQNMVGRLRRALVKAPVEREEHLDRWREFGYDHRPDLEGTSREFHGFVDALKGEGVEVVVAREPQEGALDAVFVTDPGVMTNGGLVIGRMGKALRRGEEAALAKEAKRLGIPILGRVQSPGTLEGGDVLWLDPDTVVVGRTYRTNDHGFLQLRGFLGSLVETGLQVHLPHWRGPGDLLHLMSIISPVDVDLALVRTDLMPIPLLELLKARSVDLVNVAEEEFHTKGCNVLALRPRRVLMVEGNPRTQKALEARGVEVVTYPGGEVSVNRGGGPTCLTLALHREA